MKSFRERSPVLVGILSLVLLTTAVGFAFNINKFRAVRGVYIVSADLVDAAGLRSGNEVRVAGIKVGRVTGVSLEPDAARVEMELERDVALPRSIRLEVKLKNLLGQKFVELQMPRSLISGEPVDLPAGTSLLEDGDVIPRDRTKVPFDIYQAANEGTAVLEEIDKRSLRRLLNTLAGTFGRSNDELRSALVGLDRMGKVLGPKSARISRALRNVERLTSTLAGGGSDVGGILRESAEVLDVLAERRATISSLLAAADDLGQNLGTLIQVARGSVQGAATDLDGLLSVVEADLQTLEVSLQELALTQEMFAANLSFGRFVESNLCAVTTADTCIAHASPDDPGVPIHGLQPSPSPAARYVP